MMEDLDIAHTAKNDLDENGRLVDITDIAEKLGFVGPFFITAEAWREFIVPPDRVADWQDTVVRTWDVLWMLRAAILRNPNIHASRLEFDVPFHMELRKRQIVRFRAVNAEAGRQKPVMAIMLARQITDEVLDCLSPMSYSKV